MNLSKAFASVAIALGVTATAMSAGAATVVVTYTGTVSSGIDQTGLFGTVGADLTGDSFIATYTTTAYPGARIFSGASYSEIVGGSYFHTAAVTTAAVTINGHHASYDGGYIGQEYQSAISSSTAAQITSISYNDSSTEYVVNSLNSASNPFVTNSDYHSPPNYTVHAGDGVAAGGHIREYNPRMGLSYYIDFNTTSVSAGGVPEPTSWVLMIGGFGMVSAVLRRRRTTTVVA